MERATISLRILLTIVVGLAVANQAAAGTDGMKSSSPIATKSFQVSRTMEVGLEIEARSSGASWARKGAEAAALSISVDGKYNQDLLLWAGDARFVYRVMLGRLRRGRHAVQIAINPARSAAGARHAEIVSLKPILSGDIINNNDEDELALKYSPILFARANAIDRFTDVPLLMYYEASRKGGDRVVRYTVIFSNEDGGTPATALMARWGRATDIEWVYEIRARGGRILEETYQGVEHETKHFTGKRANGEHPLLAVASDNNNFSDLASSAVRFALMPARARLEQSSRESVMDSNPWTYRVMAEELQREKRIVATPIDQRTMADPREYLYVEAYSEQREAAVSIAVAGGSSGKASASDLNDARLRVERSGFFRIALRLTKPVSEASTLPISLRCHATREASREGHCDGVRVTKAFVLDENYLPREFRISGGRQLTLAPGEAASFNLSR